MCRWWCVVVGAAASGCSIENSFGPQSATDIFSQSPVEEVDILFVVDDSNSMAEEQEALANGFTSFITELQAANSNFHIGVVSTSQDTTDPERGKLLGDPPYLTAQDDYVALFQERVGIGTGGSDKEKGLDAAARALSPELLVTHNAGFIRSQANLLVIIVSDEDDCSDDGRLDGQESSACYNTRDILIPVKDMVTRIFNSKVDGEMVQLAAIVGPFDSSCADSYAGYRYVKAAEATGGLVGKICDPDWSSMLYELGLNAVGILDRFKLTNSANVETLEITVDDVPVEYGDINGWTYDPENWVVQFHGYAVPPRGATVVIEYEISSY